MTWNLDSERPIYIQIVERIQRDIVSGMYLPGDRLPSVRELAVTAAVNPNTMQRALVELESTGLVHSERTSGRFITLDNSIIQTLKDKLAQEHTLDYLTNMKQLGIAQTEINKLITETLPIAYREENEE